MDEAQARQIGHDWQQAMTAVDVDWWTEANAPYGDPEAVTAAFVTHLRTALPDVDAAVVVPPEGEPPLVLALDGTTLFEATVLAVASGRVTFELTAQTLDPLELQVGREALVTPDAPAGGAVTEWTIALGGQGEVTLLGHVDADGPVDAPERFGWAVARLIGWQSPWATSGT